MAFSSKNSKRPFGALDAFVSVEGRYGGEREEIEDREEELRESLPEMLLRLKGALCSCSDSGIARGDRSERVTDSVADESVNRYDLALSVFSEGTEDAVPSAE